MTIVKFLRLAVFGIGIGLSAPAFAAFAVGSVVENPATLAARDLDELIGMVGDGINPSQIAMHGGDFEAYFQGSENFRAGKVFEAVVAERANLKLLGGKALLVTAAEGEKQGAADMMLATKNQAGYVVNELYQLKLGSGAAKQALTDLKYAGMKVITTQEAYDQIAEEVRRGISKKASLGKEISPEIANLKEALESGRILKELPGGVPLPTREEVKAISKVYYSDIWEKLCKAVQGSAATAVAPVTEITIEAELTVASIGMELLAADEALVTSGAEAALSSTRRLANLTGRLLQELGRGAMVLDVGYTSWLVGTACGQWQDGSMATDEFLVMSSMRTIKMCLEIAAIADPELFSKAAFTVAFIVVSGVDYACEQFFNSKREDLRVALMSLETEERYQMTRQIVLGN